MLNKQRITELVREVDPTEQLEEEVEEMLLSIADDFIESTVNAACRLAKHRGARSLDVKDVQMYLGEFKHSSIEMARWGCKSAGLVCLCGTRFSVYTPVITVSQFVTYGSAYYIESASQTLCIFFLSERNWHMWLPGFGTDELRPYKRAPTTEAHKQRLALIRKAIKKY